MVRSHLSVGVRYAVVCVWASYRGSQWVRSGPRCFEISRYRRESSRCLARVSESTLTDRHKESHKESHTKETHDAASVALRERLVWAVVLPA